MKRMRRFAKAPLHRRPKPGVMNKTEAAYAEELKAMQAAGVIHCWWYEAVKIRLTYDSCFLTPDFLVQLPDGTLEFHDVKGGPTEGDAAIKQKVLVDLFPFRLIEVRRRKGVWVRTEISGGEP